MPEGGKTAHAVPLADQGVMVERHRRGHLFGGSAGDHPAKHLLCVADVEVDAVHGHELTRALSLLVAGEDVDRLGVSDRPGELAKLLALFADEHANVVSIEHHREGMDVPVTESEIELRTVDVHIRRLRIALNGEHNTDLIRTVRAAGYALDATPG